ncbi:hypothetical protein LCGC14_0541120 [marine sediment metagenome]|uniref:Uncharacterized protein n=1 Tax=marine sediment metagenome TaxID=412755 RepID=A0A0F9V0W5_9ZZZZ
MAETRKELALALFDQGKRPSDPEVKALGLKPKTCYNYFQDWKKLRATPSDEQKGSAGEGKGSSGQGRTVVGGRAVEVGKITITTENWGFTQYGAILILDTYHQAKRDINYGGTVGEFLCDITEFYRRIVNYKEVQHGGGDGEGRSSTEEDGRTSPDATRELAPQH